MQMKRHTASLEELKKHLSLDKYALDDELEKQATVYYEICEAAASALSKRDTAKHQLELTDARLGDEIRTKAGRLGEKMTEAKLAQEVTCAEEHVQAYEEYLEAKHQADLWAALKEAFSQKGHALREMADLYVSGYFAGSDIKTGVERPNKDKADYERDREQIAQQRRVLNKKS